MNFTGTYQQTRVGEFFLTFDTSNSNIYLYISQSSVSTCCLMGVSAVSSVCAPVAPAPPQPQCRPTKSVPGAGWVRCCPPPLQLSRICGTALILVLQPTFSLFSPHPPPLTPPLPQPVQHLPRPCDPALDWNWASCHVTRSPETRGHGDMVTPDH